MEERYLFLSPEWVHEAVKMIQAERSTDRDFAKQTRDFSLRLIYVVTELPDKLRSNDSGPRLVVMIELERGVVRDLWVGTDIPDGKSDFTVTTSYETAKQMFLGKANPATTFVDGNIKVEPLRRVYQRPRFTARAIVTANAMLRIARRLATDFPDGTSLAAEVSWRQGAPRTEHSFCANC